MAEDWRSDLDVWLGPFLVALRHKTRVRMCPAYIAGLIGPGDRKSIQPMAARAGDTSYDQLHHFVASGVWDAAPLEAALLSEADRMVGRDDAWLIIDDTSLPKKGAHSVGVSPQYASALGKNANCQTLVSLTLASREVPVMVGLRLFLPDSWISDPARLDRAGVPQDRRDYRTKPEIALAEIDRIRAAGVRFGCVLADAGYGLSAPFRQALSDRGLTWAVGIPYKQKVYPADVARIFPVAGRGRPRKRHIPDVTSISAQSMLETAKWRTVSWRRGTKEAVRPLRRPARARCRRPASTYSRHGSSAPARRGSLTRRRTSFDRRAQILPVQSAARYHAEATRRRHQGALGLRAGASATQRRARSRPFRREIVDRLAPTLPDVDNRLRFPSVPPPQRGKRGGKNRRATTTTEPARDTTGNPRRSRATATIAVPALPQTPRS